jgi:hypothetical protein
VSPGTVSSFTDEVEETPMHADDIKARLHGALHRHPKATEDEVEAIAVVVLAIVGEVTAELAIVIGELAARVDALEHRA